MKIKNLILPTLLCLSTHSYAGGDIQPVFEPAEPVVIEEAETTEFYVGLGITAISARSENVSLDFTSVKTDQDRLGNVNLLAGYTFNEYLNVEGRYTTSIAYKDTSTLQGASLFAKVKYPVIDDVEVYALLGYGQVTIDSKSNRQVDVDDSGFQWGLGASYKLDDDMNIFIDYTSLANDMDGVFHGYDGASADAITIGLTYSF